MGKNADISVKLEKFRETMLGWGQSELAIKAFEQKFRQLECGETGLIPEESLNPVENLDRMEDISSENREYGSRIMDKAVMIKLNGGLGTSMGMDRAKSLLEIRDGLSFLDIIARHAESQGAALILMNSARTRANSLELFRKYSYVREQEKRIPLDFEQSKSPKVTADNRLPASCPSNPDMEWCPAGHGELFSAIHDHGVLTKLIEAGYEYAFISNSDNLSASLNPAILGYMAMEKIPFLMEVTRRTPSDRKGGHLAFSVENGSLILRESAQCRAEDEKYFQDITRHRFFNTNNLWINLRDLHRKLEENGGLIPLPLIRNEKNVNPADPDSPRVYQLESAMGAAISFFPGARALQVPRTRFMPVKSCEDLLVLRSDRIRFNHENYTMSVDPACGAPDISVKLDERYYKFIDDWDKAFPEGPPSLRDCSEFCVSGPFLFGADIKAVGKVTLVNRGDILEEITSGTVLEGFYLA